jgi:protein arginine phosphatase
MVEKEATVMVRILFVCTGNTCRSPMAEAILRSKGLPNVEVKSAGVYAMDGMQASGHAQAVLTDNEIAHNHLSKMLTEQEVKWATYILTMTAAHRDTILHNLPDAAGKTFTLKEFIGEGHKDVFDPFGGNKAVYQETYLELQEIIKKIIGKL